MEGLLLTGPTLSSYNLICIPSDHSPFESKANEEIDNGFLFSGTSGTITVGGDVIIDNNNEKLFKDNIITTLCQVTKLPN